MYCDSCGAYIDDPTVKYCPYCGAKVDFEKPSEKAITTKTDSFNVSTPQPAPAQTPTQVTTPAQPITPIAMPSTPPPPVRYVPPVPARSWGMYVLLSFITFGIAYIIYRYLNYKDLRDHYFNHPNEKAYPTYDINPDIYIILDIILAPIIVWGVYSTYKKYMLLHNHILTTPYKPFSNAPSGGTIVFVIILTILLSFISLGFITFIYLLYAEYKWQNVFNQHLMLHGGTMGTRY